MIVLELLASRHFTGPAEKIIHLMRGLAGRGHRVIFAHTQKPSGTLAAEVASEPIEVFRKALLLRKGLVVPRLFLDVLNLHHLVEISGEHVICHAHTSHDHWTAWCLARMSGASVSVVRSIHETRQAKKRFADTPLFRGADRLIAISEGMKSTLASAYGIDPEKIAVIPGSVDTDKFKPGLDASAILDEIGVDEKTPLLGIVSRIKGGRGHRQLVEAFAGLAEEFQDLRLMIVGRGESKGEIEELVRARGLADRIHFMGYRRDDLPQIYNAMRAKIILGEGSDGTCRAALEAMACGVPVIAAKVGSLPESVADGKTGLLIDGRDERALANAMRRYAGDPDLAAAHGAAARRQALRRFAIESMVDKTESLFSEIVREKNER